MSKTTVSSNGTATEAQRASIGNMQRKMGIVRVLADNLSSEEASIRIAELREMVISRNGTK